MLSATFSQWLDNFQQQARLLNERRLVLLVGDDSWALSLLTEANVVNANHANHANHDNDSSYAGCLVYGDSDILQANVPLKRFRMKLGSESDYVIFADSQLSIDALAALSGTIVAGGVLFLVVNDYSTLKGSLFYQRFLTIVASMPVHQVIEQQHSSLPRLSDLHNQATAADHVDRLNSKYTDCITQEQAQAVTAIVKVARGKRKRPLVLTADRGRGKSSALAIACGELLNQAEKDNPLSLVITASDVGSLQVFFKQLKQSVTDAHWQDNRVVAPLGIVEFIAIDQLLKLPYAASLVMVDEAATIPVYILEQLAAKYHRMVFSSTVHGYEGAGRGFTLKFLQKLKVLCPQWQRLHINQPIRYRAQDPLEQLIYKACLLDATFDSKLDDVPEYTSQMSLAGVELAEKYVVKLLSASTLLANEALLTQVVSVLVTAHYQTKPSDVKMLLDNPQVQLLCLFEKGEQVRIVAVAMLMIEGRYQSNSVCTSISSDEITAVVNSQRRLSNHFTPQSLLTQCGFMRAFDYSYLRVVRIAVAIQYQQQGLGQYFLAEIANYGQQQGVDFVASSFGATKELLSFWLKQDFHLARLGFTKDKASGEYSALVLKALNDQATEQQHVISNEFYRSFDVLLTDEYNDLSTGLVALILHHSPAISLLEISTHDRITIDAFIQGNRQYSCCVFSLQLWLKQLLAKENLAEQPSVAVLIARIMQKQAIAAVCAEFKLTGKKALEQCLRQNIAALDKLLLEH